MYLIEGSNPAGHWFKPLVITGVYSFREPFSSLNCRLLLAYTGVCL